MELSIDAQARVAVFNQQVDAVKDVSELQKMLKDLHLQMVHREKIVINWMKTGTGMEEKTNVNE